LIWKFIGLLKLFDETEADILRRLLDLLPLKKQDSGKRGMSLRNEVVLPDGTLLRGTHNGAEHQAEIRESWILLNGKRYKSPSGAATAIRGYSEDGWRFWKVKRPQDSEWVLLDKLRNKKSIAKRRIINLSKEELAEFD
jgi:hypothetical protein